MSVSAQSIVIQEALRLWAEPLGGVASVVSNLREMWNEASQSSQKPRVLICFMGERARGPFSRAAISHRVDREWAVAVIRGRGFTSNRGDTLNTTVSNQIPFYDCVEAVRDILREMGHISAENIVDFKSVRPMQLGNLVIDGYLIDFSTAIDLSTITE